MNIDSIDQTQFINESPFYQDPTPVEPQQLTPEEEKQLKQKKMKKIFLAVFGVLFISLLIFIVIQARSRTPEQVAEEEPVEEISEVILGPFNQRVVELQNELENADPSQENLPFPPVDFEISLEE